MIAKTQVASGAVGLTVLAAVVVHASTDSDAVATTCYLGVLLGASLGAWIGAGRATPGRRLVPGLIAAGITLTALGDLLWEVLDLTGYETDVSIADPPWFASYLVLCVALCVVLARSRSRVVGGRLDLDPLIDAATVVVVSVLVIWSLSVDSIAADDSVTPFVRTVWASYPIVDAVLLALVVRVLMSRGARSAIGTSFAAGVCLWLAVDIAYLIGPHSNAALEMMDLAWMVAPVLLARATWRDLDIRPDTSDAPVRIGWVGQLTVAVGALLVPAALEIVSDLRGEPDQPVQLLIGTALLIALAFVRTARLIHSEERARRELEVARDAALEASRAKSMFLANMSHEIRTPLTTVLATREILVEDTNVDDVQVGLLEKMERSGDILRSLVEGILDFSRIEAGQLELKSTTFDLHALVADTADTYGARATQTDIRFVWDLDPRVHRMVVGDPGRLFQVLTNILDNALKFTHYGQVSLHVRPAELDAKDSEDCVEFVVRDTGIGIPEDDHASVFESFSQVDGSTTRRYGGNGLGLAICQELVMLMGGTITLESQFGIGSTFVVRIPLARGGGQRIAVLHPVSTAG